MPDLEAVQAATQRVARLNGVQSAVVRQAVRQTSEEINRMSRACHLQSRVLSAVAAMLLGVSHAGAFGQAQARVPQTASAVMDTSVGRAAGMRITRRARARHDGDSDSCAAL